MSWIRRITLGRDPRRTLTRVAVLTVVSVVTFGWLLTPVRVSGISMEPTYHDSTLNLVNRIVYRIAHRGAAMWWRFVSPGRTCCM